MAQLKKFDLEVGGWRHVSAAKRRAVDLAAEIGLSNKEAEEIAIVVTELAENLVKHHAVDGRIAGSAVEDGDRRGIQIISQDRGPGIADPAAAVRDGYSGSEGLGIGLGAVRRLMDEFDISSKNEKTRLRGPGNRLEGIGTVIFARKWLREKEPRRESPEGGTRFGAVCRPKIGETHNGDTFFLQHFGERTFAAVVDGVGHGLHAQEAAREAYRCLTDHYRRPLDFIITEMHRRLRGTRGAAVSLARIDKSKGKLDYTGIGNVVTRVFKTATPVNPTNYNGIVGGTLRSFKVFSYPWSRGNLIVMTSDGVSASYDFGLYPGLIHRHPVTIANVLLRDYGRTNDDATILVGGPVV